MKLKLESGYRGLEGIATEGATGWDEVGNLRNDNQEEEQSMQEQADEINALLARIEEQERAMGISSETDTSNETDLPNAKEFEDSMEKAEEMNRSFGKRAMDMDELLKNLFD